MFKLGLNSETSSVWDYRDKQLQDGDINEFTKRGYLWFVNSIFNIHPRGIMIFEHGL